MSESNQKIRLLIIDDDEDYNFLTQEMIRDFKLDCEIDIKRSAQEALDYLASENSPFPDIIFLDINMHGLNGWDFIEEYETLGYHEKQADTEIYMTSTSVYEDIKDRARGYSRVVDYIEKPLTFDHLHHIQNANRKKSRNGVH